MLRRRSFLGITLTSPLLLAGCASQDVSRYANEKPELDLAQYFNGRVFAHGVFQDRSGEVVKRFTVIMDCKWEGNQGVIDETFTYSDGSTQRRVWSLTKHPEGRYVGTADDVVGEAVGYTSGNAFNWHYTLRLPVKNSVYEVNFDDWMYLVDEQVMLNRATMKKFGWRLGEVILSFSKTPAP